MALQARANPVILLIEKLFKETWCQTAPGVLLGQRPAPCTAGLSGSMQARVKLFGVLGLLWTEII